MNIGRWMKEIREQGEPDVQLMLVGNKCDLNHLRQVETSEAEEFAQKNNLSFKETSAQDGTNVDQSFYWFTLRNL